MAPNGETMPKIDLTTFILSISSAAFMGLGVSFPEAAGGDGTGAPQASGVDLDLAKQNIDLLELMHEKTRGNRTSEEDRLLEQLLFETRMRFVEVQTAARTKAGKA